MFIRILLIGVLLAALMGFLRWYANAPKEEASRILWRASFGLIILILVGMALTGRLNWLFALLAVVVAFARKLIPLLRFLPFLNSVYRKHQANNQANNQTGGQQGNGANRNQTMSKKEALEVLGLQAGASREDIIAAHRKLMFKAHPDRGGSDWLAARVNQAKSTLLPG